jgi:hypothetical protein
MRPFFFSAGVVDRRSGCSDNAAGEGGLFFHPHPAAPPVSSRFRHAGADDAELFFAR